MPTIMADHDVEGHLQVLLSIWSSPDWKEFWADVSCQIESFERLGFEPNASDSLVWRTCQELGIVLITGNRNAESDDSLEETIRRENAPSCLPVLTIADANRLMRERDYAEFVAARLLERLQDIERLRGAGRLYLP
jgi:hypothetical protein